MTRKQGVFGEVKARRPTHVAFAILLGDVRRILEQTLEAVHEIDVVLSVQERRAAVHRREGVLKELPALKNAGEGSRRTAVPVRLRDVLIHRQGVGLDGSGELGHRGIDDAAGEVIQRQREFGRLEVQVHTTLSGDLQRDLTLFRVRVCRERGAGTGDVLVRQADAESVADLRAVFGERGIVLAIDRADEVQLLVQDAQGFPRDHVDSEQRVRHVNFPSWEGASSRRAVCGFSARSPWRFGHCGGACIPRWECRRSVRAYIPRPAGPRPWRE